MWLCIHLLCLLLKFGASMRILKQNWIFPEKQMVIVMWFYFKVRQCQRGIFNWWTDLAPKMILNARGLLHIPSFSCTICSCQLYTSKLTETKRDKTVSFFDGRSIWLTELITKFMKTEGCLTQLLSHLPIILVLQQEFHPDLYYYLLTV